MANTQHLALARQGKDAWNAWRKESPGEPADFSGADFTLDENKEINFTGLKFGEKANFRGAKFGEGVDFQVATFGYGASFDCATFGRRARFEGATFGDEASFLRATFDDRARFTGATFGDGAHFVGATFGERAFFEDAKFRHQAHFMGATFGDKAHFVGTTFGDEVDFMGAVFGGGAFFGGAAFRGWALFEGTTFRPGAFFEDTTFSGNVYFNSIGEHELEDLRNWISRPLDAVAKKRFEGNWNAISRTPDVMEAISFAGVRFRGHASFAGRNFRGPVDFAHAYFDQPPDFSATGGWERLSLTGTRFGFSGEIRFQPGTRRAFRRQVRFWTTNPDVATQLRQLRGIANEIRAVDAERDLFILERMAERGVLWKSWWQRGWRWRLFGWLRPDWWQPLIATALMFLYRTLSDCGRSVVLPIMWLCVANFGFYLWYARLVPKPVPEALLNLTVSSMLPFGVLARPALDDAVKMLFDTSTVTAAVQAVAAGQGLINLVLLFLLGLALRNHFRVR